VTEDDGVLEALIDEVYAYLEEQTGRRYLGQTWKLYLDGNEIRGAIKLPLVPLISISSIITTDDDGDTTTVDSSNYQVITGQNPKVVLTTSGEWPSDARDYEGMAITAVTGYGGTVVVDQGFDPASPTSPGLDDLTAGLKAAFSGTAKTSFEVVIDDATSSPNSFKWRKATRDANGVKTIGSWTEGVNITGAAQDLADNVTVTFAATTGHTLNDAWLIQARETLPPYVQNLLKALILYFYNTKGSGVQATVSGQLIGIPHHLKAIMNSLRVQPF
jgi:hypothetical protein